MTTCVKPTASALTATSRETAASVSCDTLMVPAKRMCPVFSIGSPAGAYGFGGYARALPSVSAMRRETCAAIRLCFPSATAAPF